MYAIRSYYACRAGHVFGVHGENVFLGGQRNQPVGENTDRDDEAREGPRNPDVKKNPIFCKWGADFDHRPHRPERIYEEMRNRDVVGQGRAYPVVFRGKVVTEFVGREDRQDAQGIGSYNFV